MANIQVVKLSPEEWQPYKQIRLEALSMEPKAFSSRYVDFLQRPDTYWQGRLIEAQAGENSWLLFAKENDQIIGMIGAFRAEEHDVVDIISLYVTKEKRRQGVAATLMTAILETAGMGEAFRKAALTVNADQTGAFALYQQFGFQIVGEIAEVMGDGESHLSYVMEKDLGKE